MKRIAKSISAFLLTLLVICATGCGRPGQNKNNNDTRSEDRTEKVADSESTGDGDEAVFSDEDLNGHDYVDLGLPSGTLWATCNVGASTPEEYGDYFAWGETRPKTRYDWGTYRYSDGGEQQLTKYCSDSSEGNEGFTDELAELQPEDDAATVQWGSAWRMPTERDWNELYQLTSQAWKKQNGVSGCLFTASNGQSLFLPAAGMYWDDHLDEAGAYCYYWSASLFVDGPAVAYGFVYESDYSEVANYDRYYGWPVRPVRVARKN